MSTAPVEALLDKCRVSLPGANDEVIQMELFNTVDELCREALRIVPPNPLTRDAVNVDSWMPLAEWQANFQLLMHGVLTRMLVQPNKPYTSPELAKYHFEQYNMYLDRSRSEAAASPTTTYTRILFNVRTLVPMARDAAIELEIYNASERVRKDALGLDPMTPSITNPEIYFPDAATWNKVFLAVLHGTLYAMYGQPNKSWSSPELSKAHYEQYILELDRVRSVSTDSPTSTYLRLLYNLRVLMPFARVEAIELEFFTIIDRIRREALRLPPLTKLDTNPALFLPTDAAWNDSYQAIVSGMQFAMYAQANKPWTNPTMAQQFNGLFMQELDKLRTEYAAEPTSTYERLVFNLRTQMPMVRDATIRLELYNCIDEIRREALRLPPLDADDVDPDEFLPDPETWAQCYKAILHCALYALYGQANKEWSKPDFAKIQYALYQKELEQIRTEESSDPETVYNRLIDNARIHLPGAQDVTLRLELFNALDEFCTSSLIWQEGIDFRVQPNKQDYYLVPGEPGKISRLMYIISGEDQYPVYGSMQTPGDLILRMSPNGEATYTAVVAKSVTDPTDRDGFPEISRWILERYHNEILDGLLYRMMTQPAKPYTNEKLSVYHMRKFRGACANARTDMMRKNVYRTQAWRFPRFAVN